MRTVAYLTAAAVLAATAPWAYGQGGDPNGSLQQRLSSQLALTQVARDRSGVVNSGTLLILQKDNLLMYFSACPSSPVNTYANGKLSQGFGHNLLRDLGGTMRMAGNATTADCPQRRFVRGTKLWVTKIEVQKDAVVFRLYATPDNDMPYYGDLKLPFEKGPVPPPGRVLATIAEVLTVQPAGNPATSAQLTQAPGDGQEIKPPEPAEPPVVPLKLPSAYVSTQTPSDQLQLNSDNSFSLQEDGQTYHGTFLVNGGALELSIGESDTKTTVTIHGAALTDGIGQSWVLREQAEPKAPVEAPLNNQDVIKMVKAGLSDTLIVAKIRSSKCQFDTSANALIQLKQSGVSDAVFKAVFGAGT